MSGWLEDIRALLERRDRGVLVSVIGVRGSAPREIGARMLVTERETRGTIGGGQLEYQCIRAAVDKLRATEMPALWRRRYPLGADCGQCCGGVVEVLFEDVVAGASRFDDLIRTRAAGRPALLVTRLAGDGELRRGISTAPDELANAADGIARRIDQRGGFVLYEPIVDHGFDVAVFGAGHVGSATVALLSTLDANIRWIDSRASAFPERPPRDVQTLISAEPAREVAALPADCCVLVMTHSHPLDFEICSAALQRDDIAWIGLIGSRSKRRRFEKRFRAEGVAGYERIVCPIGIEGIYGKKPAEIALAVSAQLVRHRDRATATGRDRSLEVIEGEAG